MFLLILDKNPYKAAELIPDRLKFKQLLELCQLICSAGISDVYKPIKQGKELQSFCKKNIEWIYVFFNKLFIWAEKNIKMSEITYEKLCTIRLGIYFNLNKTEYQEPQTAIFRYVKDYAEMTNYESNSELSIDECVECYKKYVEWKEEQFNKKRAKKKEEKWQKIIKKGCEHEWHPQQDVCFCKLNAGYICWWKNCPMINKKVQRKEV